MVTLMLLATSSFRRLSARPRRANFVGAYELYPTMLHSATAELTRMRWPCWAASMLGRTACSQRGSGADLDGVQRAEVVEVHLAPVLLERNVAEVSRLRESSRADQDINRAAMVIGGLLGCGLDGGSIGHIAGDRQDLARAVNRRLDLSLGNIQIFLGARHDGHKRPRFRQPLRNREPEAGAAPGDEHMLSGRMELGGKPLAHEAQQDDGRARDRGPGQPAATAVARHTSFRAIWAGPVLAHHVRTTRMPLAPATGERMCTDSTIRRLKKRNERAEFCTRAVTHESGSEEGPDGKRATTSAIAWRGALSSQPRAQRPARWSAARTAVGP
eukprot:m.7509 g.7509  ORF g.7509 m.7509 type:complete len:329 (+) comp2198_c0_seq1:385-1371(+)